MSSLSPNASSSGKPHERPPQSGKGLARAERKQQAEAARQARREQTRKQIEQIKADRAKRAECSKKARAQKVLLGDRPNFITSCMGK